jgi:8-oxo-dGTP pyrophosphatase MutT (NUDIX family)
MSDGDKAHPVPAKPSSTIVVLRDGNPQPEMLMVKRRAGDAFGDSYAFPGGVVDEDESVARNFCRGITAGAANVMLGIQDGGLDYYSAGIRELFEETGVLLAQDQTGKWACDESLSTEFRTLVDKGLLPWPEFLKQRSLRMVCDSLHYFAHWETPFDLPKRWTTRFFAAQLPTGQDACHDGTETTDSRWMSAVELLSEEANGQIAVPYPTIRTLEKLQHFNSIDALLAWTLEQQAAGIGLNRLDSVPGMTR